MNDTAKTTITIGGRHFTDDEFAEAIGWTKVGAWTAGGGGRGARVALLRDTARGLARAMGTGSAIDVLNPEPVRAGEHRPDESAV